MRILYVWDGEYPWDVRTEKVCLALVQAGHQVTITARNLRAQDRHETRPEGTIERLPSGPAWSRRWLSFPAFFNPLWLRHLVQIVAKHSIEMIIVRDLPLAPAALLVAGGRIPTILDMAENYPAMIQDVWTDGRQRPFDILVRNPAVVARVERLVINRVDHIITVVDESRQRLLDLNVPQERVSVVSNTPPTERITSLSERRSEEPLRLVYLGLMEVHRGIGQVLEAAALLKRSGVSFHLDLIGDGRDYDHFRGHAATLGLTTEHLTFHGRVAHDRAIALVAHAHVGLVPHKATASWNATIPNKLFDYMAAGLAVISSDAWPAGRVIRETGSGLVFRSGNDTELAGTIRRCLDVRTWDQYRRAGQHAIRTKYNWESDSRILLDVVSRVGNRRARP